MLIIPIKDGENIDRALKRFKRKFDKTGTKRSLQTRKEFLKPSNGKAHHGGVVCRETPIIPTAAVS